MSSLVSLAALLEATETGNLELAKPLLQQLNVARNGRSGVWLDMLAFIEGRGTARELAKLKGATFDELYGLVYKRVRPKLESVIAEREKQLDSMLEEFRTLSPKLRERANRTMEGVQEEIEQLKRDTADLREPWNNLRENVAQRQAALATAEAILSNGAAGRQKTEALASVVDRIVCHFHHTATKGQKNNGKSILDRVEIHAIAGQEACLINGNTPGPSYLSKALYRVYSWAEIEPIYGQPWAESMKKAVEARKAAAKSRREAKSSHYEENDDR